MPGFIYNGKSTKNAINSSELILASFDSVDSVTGMTRDAVSGESTIAHPIANEYGTTYSNLEIEYGLIKKNKKPFTEAEQQIIETWLTSPKISQDIQIYDCENNITDIYCGKFTETEWKPMSGGFAGLTFKFTCNSAYGKKKFSQTYSINGSKINITINNLTDELEEYVYPVLDIYQTSTTNANITIKNKTDNNNSMSFLTRRNNHMIIDCKNCIPWAIWTGASKGGDAPFHVGHDGGLYASKATIKGSITATSGKIGNCSIENGRLVLGDTMNYANLNANTYGNYGFKLVADGNNNPWFQFNDTPQRDILISPVGYNSYKCNGGEWFRIEFEFSSTVQATTAETYGSNTYVNINVGLYGINTSGSSCWFIPVGARGNSTGSVQKVSTAIQLDSSVRSFSVFVQCQGYGTFSGTLKIRNVSVYRMMGNELIVDGAITAAKIRSGEVTSDKIAANAITSDKITTNNIAGTNGWINLRSGTFNYGNGKLTWNGTTMTIGGWNVTSDTMYINNKTGISANTSKYAFWAGESNSKNGDAGTNAKFRVGHAGSLYAEDATIKGSINASSLTAKQYYKIYGSDGKNERTFVSWSGDTLSFGLVSQNQVPEAYIQMSPGSTTVEFSGDIGATQGTIYADSIDAGGSLSVKGTSTFKGATTFNSTLTCKSTSTFSGTSTFTGALKAGSFTFRDYSETDNNNIVYRRPVASAGSDKARVAILQGTSNNKIVIKAQYNSTNFTNATFTASSSDIRLKEDVKDSSVNALSKIMQMQIREFNWKQTGVHQELGCVADELELIDPLLTTGGGYDDDGTMNIKSIDTLLLSEYAIKGIQELYKQYKKQQKRIEYLESQLNNR